MAVTTFSSREFNLDISRAKDAANHGPVVVTYRGEPAYVLLNFSEYKKISRHKTSIVDAIAMTEDIDFEPPKAKIEIKPMGF